MSPNKDYFSNLPAEVQLHIVSYLEQPRDIVQLSMASRYFDRLSDDHLIWRKLLKPAYHTLFDAKGAVMQPRAAFSHCLYVIRSECLWLHPSVNRLYPIFLQFVNLYKEKAAVYLLQTAKQSRLNAQIILSHKELYSVLIQDAQSIQPYGLIEICLLYPEAAIIVLTNAALYTFLQKNQLLTIDLLKHLSTTHCQIAQLVLTQEVFYNLLLNSGSGVQYLKIISQSSVHAALITLKNPSLYNPILLEKNAVDWLHNLSRQYPEAASLMLNTIGLYQPLLKNKPEGALLLKSLALMDRDNALIILQNAVFYDVLLSHYSANRTLYKIAKHYAVQYERSTINDIQTVRRTLLNTLKL